MRGRDRNRPCARRGRTAHRTARAVLVLCAAAVVTMAAAASALALNLTGSWTANYHCEAGGCAGSNFPATDVLAQAEGASLVTGSNGSESITGTLTGNAFAYHSSTGSYKAEGTLTISGDGLSWSGPVHDSNGTSGTYTATRASAPPGSGGPAPQLAVSGNAAPVSGAVLVRVPGSATFVALSAQQQIPFGTVVEATHGRVKVTTAGPHGGTQTGEFFEGEFVLTQGHNGLVVATLTGGDFSACPTAQQRSHLARASSSHASGKHAVRKLWANAHGSFSTKGNYAAGAVQGTEWLTEDLCEGTLIQVTRDKVKVTNLVNHRRTTVKAGHRYLAKAP
jgi:hypothetical protein